MGNPNFFYFTIFADRSEIIAQLLFTVTQRLQQAIFPIRNKIDKRDVGRSQFTQSNTKIFECVYIYIYQYGEATRFVKHRVPWLYIDCALGRAKSCSTRRIYRSGAVFVVDDIILYFLAFFTFRYHFLPMYYHFSTCCICYLPYTHLR